MKGDAIPGCNHILRYVGGSHIDPADDGSLVILGSGFLSRPKDQNRPSYNWLEYWSSSIDEQLRQVRQVAVVEYRRTVKLVRLNVGAVKTAYIRKHNQR